MYEDYSSYELMDPDGRQWLSHPEDETHWAHWDILREGKKLGRYPENCLKPSSFDTSASRAGEPQLPEADPARTLRLRREDLGLTQEAVA